MEIDDRVNPRNTTQSNNSRNGNQYNPIHTDVDDDVNNSSDDNDTIDTDADNESVGYDYYHGARSFPSYKVLVLHFLRLLFALGLS